MLEVTERTFDEMTAQGTVLVDFFAPWCGPCRIQSRVLEDLQTGLEGSVRIVKVNMDENPSLARRFQVMAIPHLVLIRDGEVVARHRGLTDAETLRAALEAA